VPVDYRLIEAMQEREHQLTEAQPLARVGSWECDVAEDRVSWSDELYRIFGLEAQVLEASYGGALGRSTPTTGPSSKTPWRGRWPPTRITRFDTGSCERMAPSASSTAEGGCR
jgi:hypothetical protein